MLFRCESPKYNYPSHTACSGDCQRILQRGFFSVTLDSDLCSNEPLETSSILFSLYFFFVCVLYSLVYVSGQGKNNAQYLFNILYSYADTTNGACEVRLKPYNVLLNGRVLYIYCSAPIYFFFFCKTSV